MVTIASWHIRTSGSYSLPIPQREFSSVVSQVNYLLTNLDLKYLKKTQQEGWIWQRRETEFRVKRISPSRRFIVRAMARNQGSWTG